LIDKIHFEKQSLSTLPIFIFLKENSTDLFCRI